MLSPYSQISVDRETGAFSFDLDLICSVLALAFVQLKVVIEKGNLFDQRQIQSQLSENGVTNESTILGTQRAVSETGRPSSNLVWQWLT